MSAIPAATCGRFWHVAQKVSWFLGLFVIAMLFAYPRLGIHLVWDVLIPLAPALIVVAPGLWRNICPLNVTACLPTRLQRQRQVVPTRRQAASLQLAGVLALYALVPLRHAWLDRDATATGIVLIAMGAAAFLMGWWYDHKSGWCASLCPVHAVERLYGQNPVRAFANAHCRTCRKCSVPCPDATPHIHPMSVQQLWQQKVAGLLMVGGFPGFIWGWFHVPDYTAPVAAHAWIAIYGWPLGGAAGSMGLFLLLRSKVRASTLIKGFAAAAVSCYYFYRIPCLLGFGLYPGDGMLIDLRALLPPALVWGLASLPALFFFWWLVWRARSRQSWLIRPAFAKKLHRH